MKKYTKKCCVLIGVLLGCITLSSCGKSGSLPSGENSSGNDQTNSELIKITNNTSQDLTLSIDKFLQDTVYNYPNTNIFIEKSGGVTHTKQSKATNTLHLHWIRV